MNRILITGHKGAIGSRLLKQIASMDAEFFCIDTHDGQDILTCELPENIDVIYHLAAHASVEESWKDPVRNMQNLLTTVRLSHFYPRAKIIFASSCATIDPASPYAFSKKCAADYLKTFHPESVIMVFPNIYGTGRSVVDYFKGQERVTIYGDGEQRRDYVHVDDIVCALEKAFLWEPGEYFLGSGITTSVLDLAEDKVVDFKPARKEAREASIPNTTPNWEAKINVMDYLNEIL